MIISVKKCCAKHPDEFLKSMYIAGFKIPFCYLCHEKVKKIRLHPFSELEKNRINDKKSVFKESWKGKQSLIIGQRAYEKDKCLTEFNRKFPFHRGKVNSSTKARLAIKRGFVLKTDYS